MTHYEVIVVGAGAAGLMAASCAAFAGRHTLLVEKNRKAGVKILISGGTRCNLTHACEARGIVAAFGSAGNFLHSPLAALGPGELVDLFHAEHLPTKVEETGKIFPQSDRALDVVRALVRRLDRSGGEMSLGEAVTGIAPAEHGFRVETDARSLSCESLIITTGGMSYPGCGTTGDAYAWLSELGHTIRPPRPALVPLTTNDQWVQQLSGVTIPDTQLQVVESAAGSASPPKKKGRKGLPAGVLIRRRGSLLFTHFGLSGPVALDVSRAVTGRTDPREVTVEADFLPNHSSEQLTDSLQQAVRDDGRKQVLTALNVPLPKSLLEALFDLAEVPHDRRIAELSKAERERLVYMLKQAPIAPSGSRGFKKAEVTAGGVELKEVDSKTMRSKLVPNLLLAGEVLDLDGFIGGFNFQGAFSTGWVAGHNA
jgi:predicted Rossmann fold flavoprotein